MEKTINKKTIKIIFAAFLAAACVLVCAGCGTGTSKTSSGVSYTTKNEVQLAMSSVKTLNPAISTDEDTYHITKLIYDGLYTLDNTLTPQKNLARTINVDKSKRRITVRLVNTEFQDGKQLTASDVKFSVSAYQTQGSKCRYYDLVKDISYVSKVNSKTCRIYFNNASDMSLAHLTFPILPAHRYGYSVSSLLSNKTDFKPVGTGALKYIKFDKTRQLYLKPYDNYHGDKATSKVYFQVMPNKGTDSSLHLLESSSLSMMVLTKETREGTIEKSDVTIKNFASPQMEMIGFNTKKTAMSDKKVRQAIATAVNCSSIIQNCYSNSGMTNDNLYFPGYLGVKSTSQPYKYDLDKAAKMLKLAGYNDDDNDDMVEDESGKELTINILVNDSTDRKEAVSIIRKSIKSLGIHVNVTASPQKTYLAALKKGNYDIFYGGYETNELCDMRDLLSTSGTSNYTGYSNTKLDKYLDQLNYGLSGNEAEDKYKQIKSIINDDLPYYCVLYKTYGAIKAPALDSKISPVFDNYYYGCGNWKCKYETSGSSSSGSSSSSSK